MVLAVSPRHTRGFDATVGTVDTPHRVHEENRSRPHWTKFDSPLGQPIVVAAFLSASAAHGPAMAVRLQDDQTQTLVAEEFFLLVHECLLLLDMIQDNFELYLVSVGVLLWCCNNISSSTGDKMPYLIQSTCGEALSASPSHRPYTGPAQVDGTGRWKGRPHSAEPEPRSTYAGQDAKTSPFKPTNSAEEPLENRLKHRKFQFDAVGA